MSKSRRGITVVLVFTLLLVAASTAMAGSPTNSNEIVKEHVDWELKPGQCADVPLGVEGSGERHMVKNTKVNADGSMVITINDVVRGAAWDSAGTYKFIYENHSVEEIPAGGGTHQITMEDNFILNGKGNIDHMSAGFTWRWTYTPPAEYWPPVDNVEKLNTRGDPLNCDPI